MQDYKIAIVLLALALLEGVHASLVQEIKTAKPQLHATLGQTGPGYYAFGLFCFAPRYRKSLLSGQLKSELSGLPKLSMICQLEYLLWYATWLVLGVVVVV